MIRPVAMLLLLLAACGGADPVVELCDNGVDDDGDDHVDCADQDCFGVGSCTESACDDGVDDDSDGLVDCDDPDCAEACSPSGCVGSCDEVCDNGVDDDRDFLVDCADDDCAAACDVDGDGWDGLGGPDCDDARADVHPDAEEVPYDGVDNDCDPSTPDDDIDGDGYGVDADCDDLAAETYPGAVEVCGNGRVDDCDATSSPGVEACFGERLFTTADVRYTSMTASGWLGSAVSPLGDVDDDGIVEIAVGMYGENVQAGAVAVVSVTGQGVFDIGTARGKFTGASEQDWVGAAIATTPKPTRPAQRNLLVSARYDDSTSSNAGAVYQVDGAFTDTVSVERTLSTLLGDERGDNFGAGLADAGDVNGDGVDDIAVGAPLVGRETGNAYVFFGPPEPGTSLGADAAIRILSTKEGAQLGAALASGRDVSGDELPDLAVGARYRTSSDDVSGAGAVLLYQELTEAAEMLDSDADGILFGDEEEMALGSAVLLADLTGDELADIVAGGPGDDGVVWVASGGQTGMLTAGVRLEGSGGEAFGSSLASGDIDGDGHEDLVVGAPSADTDAGEDAGKVYVFFGPVTSGQAPDITIVGTSAFGFLGQAVAVAPDWTGDGRDELLVGAPFVDGGASDSGEVGVFWWDL